MNSPTLMLRLELARRCGRGSGFPRSPPSPPPRSSATGARRRSCGRWWRGCPSRGRTWRGRPSGWPAPSPPALPRGRWILLPRDGVGDQQQFGAGDGGIHGCPVLSVGRLVGGVAGRWRRSVRRSAPAWRGGCRRAAGRPRCRRRGAVRAAVSSAPSTMPEKRLRPSIGHGESRRARGGRRSGSSRCAPGQRAVDAGAS